MTRRGTKGAEGSEKKMPEAVRSKTAQFGNLEWLCAVLNRLGDPSYAGPLSELSDSTHPYHAEFLTSERAAWNLAIEVLEPLGKIHLYAMKRPQNFNAAYSDVGVRFKVLLGKHALGQLVVNTETKWPHNDVDSPVWLRATVELPQAWGHGNINQFVAVLLWKNIFQEEGYKKLRRCLRCSQWFLDHGRNQIAKFCKNSSCANVYWNRGKRRQAKQRKESSRQNRQRGKS